MKFYDSITTQEHDAFVSHHPLCNLLQSSGWADVKSGWKHTITGVYEKQELIASALVLIKRLPAGFTMFYIPRGPVLDYKNRELVTFYFDNLRSYAKKQRCLFIKFDPEIHVRDFIVHEKDAPYEEETTKILENLKAANVIHKGFTIYIKETIQPRFCMGVIQSKDIDEHIPRATLRSKNTALRKHVIVERVGMERLDEFAHIMHITEERKSIQLRDKAYFQKLMKIYGEQAYLFLASVDPRDRYEELEMILSRCKEQLLHGVGNKQRKKVEEEMRQAQQELASMEEVMRKYKGEQVIAGGLMVGFGDTVEMLYAGMNEDFRAFRPQYLTYIEQFHYAFAQGYRYVNMGGVEGTLEDGLARFKANFNPVVNELIGEFDLPVNPFLYRLSERFYEMLKKRQRA